MILRTKGIDNFLVELNHWHDYDGYDIRSRAFRCILEQFIHANFSGRANLLDRLLSLSTTRDWRISDVLLLELVWRDSCDADYARC